MNLYTLPYNFAQATYGDGEYGSEGYATETTTTTESGGLANTGVPVILGGTIGVSLILCAVILLVHGRKKK